ncbi:hypothetical protein [Flavobacterium orientale]|nr:hypothetical protein [Flavobacterium orientale]
MKNKPTFLLHIVIGLQCFCSLAQDSLLTQMAQNHHTLLSVEKDSFTGSGWETIINAAQKSDFVLIGEDHFTNEVPFFCNALTSKIKFDNFICEIDPYSANIIQSKIKTLTEEQLQNYIHDFGNTFSFYALASEFDLLSKIVKSGTNVFGTDQILMIADRLICSELKLITENKAAKIIYQRIEDQSKDYFSAFLNDPSKPMYMLTEEYAKNLEEVSNLKVSTYEKEVIEKLKLTTKIYKEQNHHLRIQLMKNQLMEQYEVWKDKKNLFKFGANHVSKGESFLKIYDLGNLVDNIADSQYTSSLHLLIVGKSGSQGSPFKDFPESPIDSNSSNLKALKPFFDIVVNEKAWYCLEMLPIREKLENGEITTNDVQLSRIIKGFDYVLLIPKVTAGKF